MGVVAHLYIHISVYADYLLLASYLNIGRNLAYQLLNDGVIKGFRIGKQWRVSKQAVDLYVAKNSGLM